MNKYKCTEHKLDLACVGCIIVMSERHNLMLEFIQDLARFGTFSDNLIRRDEAKEILKKIGELE